MQTQNPQRDMADEDTSKTVPSSEGQTDKKTVPSSPTDGQTQDKGAPEKTVVPEQLKGKSQDDLIKMYGELERKLGEQGSELGQSRKFQEEMSVVLQAIYADPKLKTSVEEQMERVMGRGKTEPDKKTTPADETREAVEGQILREFEVRNGLDLLEATQRQQLYQKIGDELRDMLDPGGKKSYAEVLSSVNLTKLPQMMEKAYYLADREGTIKKAVQAGVLKAKESQAGMIGGISASSGGGNQKMLTPEEKQAAEKLGISEDDYLKSKTV